MLRYTIRSNWSVTCARRCETQQPAAVAVRDVVLVDGLHGQVGRGAVGEAERHRVADLEPELLRLVGGDRPLRRPGRRPANRDDIKVVEVTEAGVDCVDRRRRALDLGDASPQR